MTYGIEKIADVEEAVRAAKEQTEILIRALVEATDMLTKALPDSKSKFTVDNLREALARINDGHTCVNYLRVSVEGAGLLMASVREADQRGVEIRMNMTVTAARRLDSWAQRGSDYLNGALSNIAAAAGGTTNENFVQAERSIRKVLGSIGEMSATSKEVLARAEEAAKP